MSTLTPTSAAAAASAIVIIVTVAWTLPDTTPTATAEVVGGLSTAVTSFLAAAFITWTEDGPGVGLSDHIKGVFQDLYKPPREGNPEDTHLLQEAHPEVRPLVYGDLFQEASLDGDLNPVEGVLKPSRRK